MTLPNEPVLTEKQLARILQNFDINKQKELINKLSHR